MTLISPSQVFRKKQRLGHWLPKDRSEITKWVNSKVKQTESHKVPLDPSLVAFQELVAGDPALTKLSTKMFSEIPPTYPDDPAGYPQIKDFNKLLDVMNTILKEGPQFFYTDNQDAMGLIGFPINAVLDRPMGTTAGFFFFLVPAVNQALNNILQTWGAFLSSSASQPTLDPKTGWLQQQALELLSNKANDVVGNNTGLYLPFEGLYQCEPSAPYFGFNSWDGFFTRRFRPDVRPLAVPDDQIIPNLPEPNKVIVNACESCPLPSLDGLQAPWTTNVQWLDTFWLKGQPYSLSNMLNQDAAAHEFVGGSVYQAFLSALSYHRWHAPVSGTVVSCNVIPGTYYSVNRKQNQQYSNPILTHFSQSARVSPA